MLGSLRAAALFVAAVLGTHAAAQDGEFDRTPQDCVLVSRVDRTEVIDDNTIVFHMRGDDVYINYLPTRCPNLAREDSFAYQVRTSRICDSTTITVIEGAGRFPGFTCRLGEFTPVTIAEVEELRRVAEQRGRGDAIEVEQVEPPADADDAEDVDDEGDRDDD